MSTILLHKDLDGLACSLCTKEVKKGEFLNNQFYCVECALGIALGSLEEVEVVSPCVIVENQVVS